MDWTLIITFFVGGGLGGVVAAYVALKNLKPNIKILTAQEKKVIADAADVASNALIDLITAFQSERVEFGKRLEVSEKKIEGQNKKIEEQAVEIEAIKESRKQNEIKFKAERDALEVRIQSDLMDSKNIRVENAELQKQVNQLESKFIRMAKYIDRQNEDMKKAGIPVTQNGELMDSVRRLQLSIEERAKLKAGK